MDRPYRLSASRILRAIVAGGVVGLAFRFAYVATWRPPGSYVVMPLSAVVAMAGIALVVILGFVGLILLANGRRSGRSVLLGTVGAVGGWFVVAFLDSVP